MALLILMVSINWPGNEGKPHYLRLSANNNNK